MSQFDLEKKLLSKSLTSFTYPSFLTKYKNINELLNDKEIFKLDYEIQGIFNRQTHEIVQFENINKPKIIYNYDDFSGMMVDKGKLFTKNNILASFHTHPYKANLKIQHPLMFKNHPFGHFNGFPSHTDINILLRGFFYYQEDVAMYIFSLHGITSVETDFQKHDWDNDKLKKIQQDIDEISLICSNIAGDAHQFDNINDIVHEYKKYIKHLDFLSINFIINQ